MSSQREPINLDDAERPLYAGIDVGGTNIKIGLVDHQGRTLAFRRMPTEVQRGAEQACQRMAATVGELLRECGAAREDLAGAGLGTPGTMDVAAGMLLQPHNLPGWWDFPIQERLSHHGGWPVTFANDANAAAYGEYWKGSGAQFESMILLTLGTGIGGGIIVNDRLIAGEHSCGGECGHIIIDCRKDARKDNAGKSGSLEAYASAGGVVGRARDALENKGESSLHESLATGEQLTPLLIAQHAEAGDALARQIVLDTAEFLAIGIVSLVHTIDPESVVLGGAMTFGASGQPLGRAFLAHIRHVFDDRALGSLRGKIEIDFATLGGDAGYIGAAGLARRECLGKS